MCYYCTMPTMHSNLRTIRLSCEGAPSQSDVAHDLDLDRSWVAMIEQGRPLPADTRATVSRLLQLADRYDLEPSEIAGALGDDQREDLDQRKTEIASHVSSFGTIIIDGEHHDAAHTLAQQRLRKGYTQDDVASHLGVDRSVVAHLEAGQLTGDDATIIHRIEVLANLYELDPHAIYQGLTDDQRETLQARASAASRLLQDLRLLGL